MKGHIRYFANVRSIHTQRWVTYFAQHGWEVDLITWQPIPHNLSLDSEVTVHSIRSTPLSTLRFLRHIRPDIVHGHYINIHGIFASLYASLFGVRPLVLSAWGPYGLMHSRGLHKRLIKYALRKADKITTTSQFLANVLVGQFEVPQSKVMAFPWGIDLDIFHKGYEPETTKLRASLSIDGSQFVILSPRALNPHYRIEHIIHALPFIVEKHTNVILVVLKGSNRSNQYETETRKLAETLGVTQNTRWISHELPPEEMAILYNLSDAVVSIPKSDQFGSCLVEGMACGIIPIVGDLEVYKQYLVDGKNALFVNPENPQTIARQVIHCIEHPELKERFYRINEVIVKEKEDWAKNAGKMEALYVSLLQQQRR